MIKKVRIQLVLTLVFIFGISISLKAQPGNLPSPYCFPLYTQCPCNQPAASNTPGNFLNDFIHSVITFSGNVNISNINSGCNSQIFPSIGCRNYIYHKCQHNLTVMPGQVISFSIQVGQIFAQGVSAWIDWNADAIFSAAPEKIGWSATTVPGGSWLTFTTTIPPAQPNGLYRLRVRCAMGINGSSIDPCNNYSSGETEDYDVYIGAASPVISNAIASSNSTLCSGNTLSLNLTYTSQCSPTYTWNGPNAFNANSQNPTIVNAQPLHSGNYSLTVACGTACPVSLTTSVTIIQSPTISAMSNQSLICAGNQATLTAGGANNYTWTPSGSGSVIVVNPTVTTIYTVSGTATNACVGTNTVTQNVSPCTSIIDHSPIESIRVYPNPAGDVLNFAIKDKSAIKIFDVNGKLILQRTVKTGDKVDVSDLSKGIYFLYFDKETEPVKIIKE